MRYPLLTLGFLSILSLFIACNTNNEYQKIGEDFRWKLVAFGEDTKQINKGDFVQFRWKVVNKDGDSLYSTRHFIKIDSIEQNGLLLALSLLKVSETGSFEFPFVNLESYFKQQLTNSDAIFDEQTVYRHEISIDQCFTFEEFQNQKQSFLDWISTLEPVDFNSLENKVIDNYIENEGLTMEVSKSGLRYAIKKSNSGIKPKYGKWIKIKHKGGALSKEEEHVEVEQDFYVGQELQVIRALEEGLLKMEKLDTAIFIAPSTIAFGENGSGNGVIPPSTPVYFQLIIEDLED